MGQPITDHAAFFASAGQAVEELEALNTEVEQLEADEKKLESSLKGKQRSVTETISQTVKQRKEEITKSYDAELGKAQDRLKKVRFCRNDCGDCVGLHPGIWLLIPLKHRHGVSCKNSEAGRRFTADREGSVRTVPITPNCSQSNFLCVKIKAFSIIFPHQNTNRRFIKFHLHQFLSVLLKFLTLL